MDIKGMIKDAIILTIITLVAGCLLGFVYDITKEPIAKQQEEAKMTAYKQVMKDATEFKEELTDLVAAAPEKLTGDYGKNGVEVTNALVAYNGSDVVGYVIQIIDKDGYGGEIELTVGIDNDGIVTGVEILSINETVGLGMNAQKEEFRSQYVGKDVDAFVVTKAGASADNEIDALSGATITSKAMTYGVNGALDFYNLIAEGR